MRQPSVPSIGSLVSRALGVALALGLALGAPARADVFGPISMVSASPFQQVEYAHDPTISGDGRYVVFDGSIGDVTGVWRRENRPGGNLEQVAGGDAELPSISSNGQYVSFTTNEGGKLAEITDGTPDPEHATHEAPNVYVRDMAKAPGQEGAFILASPVSYEYAGAGGEGEVEEFGAEAAGRTALSADGQKVVFVTTATSDLAGPGTAPLQVGIHDLETGATELVSVEDEPATGKPVIENGLPKPVATVEGHGAVYSVGAPPRFQAPKPYSLAPGLGASISADGSTVAWMGQSLGKQVQALPGEALQGRYSEPLWRRIADGEQTPTRRVTGGSDPSNPPCAVDPESALAPEPEHQSLSDPCQGPFATTTNLGIWSLEPTVPALSADGDVVAFLANQSLVSQGSDFGTRGDPGDPSDVYVANMEEGLSRVQALRQVTEFASGETSSVATDAPILELAISADGKQVAFTTKRTVFPLSSPAYVSAPAAVPGMAELFDVDLANETLTRVTRGYEGGPSEAPHAERGHEDAYEAPGDGALSPSFSETGNLLAFSSTAANLVYGDGNTPPLGAAGNRDGSDAFVVGRLLFGSSPASSVISPAPAGPSLAPAWGLGVTAQELGNGKVMLYVQVPAAGVVSADASSSVRVPTASAAKATHNRAHKAHVKRAAPTTRVLTRTVASAKQIVAAPSGGLTTLLLKLSPSYAALGAQHGGLSATVYVTFVAPGHPALHQSIALSFVGGASVHPSKRSRTARRANSKARKRKHR